MRKKLPKAIGQTIDDLRRGKPDTRDETKSTRVSLASIPSPVPGMRAGDVLAETVRHRLGNAIRGKTVKQPKSLALVPVTKAKGTPGQGNAPAGKAGKAEKPTTSE